MSFMIPLPEIEIEFKSERAGIYETMVSIVKNYWLV